MGKPLQKKAQTDKVFEFYFKIYVYFQQYGIKLSKLWITHNCIGVESR